MLVAILTAALAADTQPATIHNAGNGDMGMLNMLFPLPGEEGHWTAIRFEAQEHDLGVSSIEATFVRQPPYPGSDVNCVVDIPHDVVVFTGTGATPPADPDVLYRATLAPIYGHPGGRARTRITLPEAIFVPQGSSFYVAFELPGTYPDVACLMLAQDQEDAPVSRETEFWSFATTAPFAWYGFDPIGIPDKPVVSISGLWYL
ncbi:MAG: hypothetical protein ACK4YP_07620 [Myxococcota bacterium]